MDLADASTHAALTATLARLAGAPTATLTGYRRLSGGAIQQNIALDVAFGAGPLRGAHRWVLRTDAPSSVAASHTRAEEFSLLKVAYAAGVRTPQPRFSFAGDRHLPPFFVMDRVEGEAAGHRLVKEGAVGDRPALAKDIGANLARLHALRPPQRDLAFLGQPVGGSSKAAVADYAAAVEHWFALTADARPVLDWAVQWLQHNLPSVEVAVLLHRDYRIGNLMVGGDRVVATLDWEFAGWGDPREDLGWFSAPCWRFGRMDATGGGVAAMQDVLDGYNAQAGTAITEDELLPWQVLAQLRWAVIALQQTERLLAGGERSLELALTGRLLPELEWQILALTGESIG
jgi:aminoglycoside phosphotransferase (APT) family kinase protein